jgi:formylglycine-generating enzyme
MKRIFAPLFLVCATCHFAPRAASAVTINWVPVGNLGNVADTAVMSDGTTGYGSVGYAYNIDKYDVTVSQYVEFLNTKDPSGANTLGLYNSSMSNNSQGLGGINFSAGNANGNKYTPISGAQNHPVNFVNWYEAIRFANWLNNGQGNGSTETGAYTLGPLERVFKLTE